MANNNTNERAGFSIEVDLDKFRQQMAEYERRLGRMERSSEQTSGSISSSFGKIKGAVGAALTGAALSGFVQKVIQARGEVQKLEIAFETMLDSSQKAQELMAQLTKTAMLTPFDMNTVAQGAKQLLAFGESSETVNNSLVRLGNIASGLSIPLNDIVYLYGTTMTQGRVFTQDIRQFLGRGIPIVKELAKNFGVTEQAVNEMVTAGKVGFEDVQKALWNMTNEGGQFFNLMEKQSKTLAGQVSNLSDAFGNMLGDLGKTFEPVLSGGLSLASTAIRNYEKIGKTIATLVAVYGTYKTALLVNMAIEKRAALARLAHIKVMKAQAAAQMALNALKNPYVAIGAAVAAVAVSVAIWTKNTDKLTRAQRRLNKELEEGRKKVDEEMTQIREYISVLQDETASIYAKMAALKELRKVQGFENLTMESAKNITSEQVDDLERKRQEEKALSTYIKREKQYIKFVAEAKESIKKIENDPNLSQVVKKERLERLAKNLAAYEKLLAKYTEERRKKEAEFNAERAEAEFERLSTEEKIKRLTADIEASRAEERALADKISKDGANATKQERDRLASIRTAIAEKQKELNLLASLTKEIQNYHFWEKKAQEAEERKKSALPNSKEFEEAAEDYKRATEMMKLWEEQTEKTQDAQKALKEEMAARMAENEAYLKAQGRGEFERRRIEKETELNAEITRLQKERDEKLKEAAGNADLERIIKETFARSVVVAKSKAQSALTAIADEEKEFLGATLAELAEYWQTELEKELADIDRESEAKIRELAERLGDKSPQFKELAEKVKRNTEASKEDAQTRNEIKNIEARLETRLKELKALEHINGEKRTGVLTLQEEKKALEDIIKAYESQKHGLTKEEETDLNQKKERLKVLNAELETSEKVIEDIYGKISALMGDISGSLAGSSSSLAKGFGQMFSAISKGFDKMSKAQQGAMSKTELSLNLVSSVISFVVDTIERARASAEENEEAQKLWRSQVRAAAHELAMLNLEAMEYKPRNIFDTDDPFKEMASAIERASLAEMRALEKLAEINSEGFVKVGTKQVTDAGGVLASTGTGASIGAGIGTAVPVIGTAAGALAGALVGALVGMFTSKKNVDVFAKLNERYGSIYDAETLELNPEILADYDKMNEKTKELIDHYKELKDVHTEAIEQMETQITEMTGEIGSELSNSLVEAFTGGDTYAAVDDFRDYVFKQMQNIIQAQIFSKVFGNMFDELEAKLKDVGATDADAFLREIAGTTAEVERLIPVYNKLTSDLKEVWARQGVSLFEEAKGLENVQNALQGTIASMSESTADELNANFLGLKLTAMEISTAVSAIREKQADFQTMQQASLNALNRVADNTAYCRRLEEINENIRRMAKEGIEIK